MYSKKVRINLIKKTFFPPITNKITMYKLLYGKYKALYLIVKKIKFSNPYIFGI